MITVHQHHKIIRKHIDIYILNFRVNFINKKFRLLLADGTPFNHIFAYKN